MEFVANYFNAERLEGLLFVCVGVVAIGVSIYIYFYIGSSFSSGVALALSFFALIQIIVGTSVSLRSSDDIIRVNQYLTADTASISSVEIPRMNTVMKNFFYYRNIEIFLILFGIFLILVWGNNRFLFGAGFGLSIQAFLTLILDFFAERRGAEYLSYLLELK